MSDKEKQNILKEFEQKLDQANNFIDYFLLVGLDPTTAFKSWIYEVNEESCLQKDLEPKIISSFPLFLKKTIAYDEGIINHCFPEGFKFIQTDEAPEPKLFSFMLDNNYFSIHYPQKYLSCLTFYESLKDYRKLYNLNNKHEDCKTETSFSMTASKSPDSMLGSQSTNNSMKSTTNTSSATFNGKNFYIPKCLVIISLYPYFNEFESILLNIYNYSKREEVELPLDKYIENYAIEIPNPPRGLYRIFYHLIDNKKLIEQTRMNELPIIDVDLRILFDYFTVEQIVDIYLYIMLEQRVVFFSSNYMLLNPFIFGLTSLLYPFKYQYQIVTILPKENFAILDSITPFIGGINLRYTKNFFEDNGISISDQDQIVVVDIDSKKIFIVFGDISGKYETAETFSQLPNFPKAHRKKLERNISSLAKIKKKKSNESGDQAKTETLSSEIDFNFNGKLLESFFDFNANVLSMYSKYLNFDFYKFEEQPDVEGLFKINDFVNNSSKVDEEFYRKFLGESQIFGDFLLKRMIPKDSNEKLEILAFDEKINVILNNGYQDKNLNVFTCSTDYDFSPENDLEVKVAKEITDNEKEYLSDEKNRINFLNYGIDVHKDKKENKFTFSYPIFPKFTSELFFYQNIRDYYIPKGLSDEINSLNQELVSKSHLGNVAIQESGMENFIYLQWVLVWATCFWYCDHYEKEYWFSLLMIMLGKIKHHEIEIFNLLFDCVYKYGTSDMVLKLYEIILKFKLNPTVKIREIVMKVSEKNSKKNTPRNSEEEKGGKKIFTDNYSFEKNEEKYLKKIKQYQNKKSFRKRTFKNEDNYNMISENIYVYAFYSCIYCKEDLNLKEICLNFSEMKRDEFWATCPNCKENIMPKISIKMGIEVNKGGLLDVNTSTFDQVVLYSPQRLKEVFTQTLVKEYGVKLDVENFKKVCPAIFWNTFWYFKLMDLDCDIFLPYEHKIDTTEYEKINSHIKITTPFLEDLEKNTSKSISFTIDSQTDNQFTIKGK